MVYSEFINTNFDVRICRIKVEKVGQGMPCQLKYKKENSLEAASTYSKSGSRTLYDTVTIDLGSTCPINYDTSDWFHAYFMMWGDPEDKL